MGSPWTRPLTGFSRGSPWGYCSNYYGTGLRYVRQAVGSEFVGLPIIPMHQRCLDHQIELLESALNKHTSPGLVNFQQAKSERGQCSLVSLSGHLHSPGQHSSGNIPTRENDQGLLNISLTCCAWLALLYWGPFNSPQWRRLVSGQGKVWPESTRYKFLRMLAVLSDLVWWIAGLSSLAKDMQPNLSHNENLTGYFFSESVVSSRILQIFGGNCYTSDSPLLHLKWTEGMAIYWLLPQVPMATRKPQTNHTRS